MINALVDNFYTKVKLNPRILLNKPWLLILIPILGIIFIKKRWHTIPEIIYLTETKINDINSQINNNTDLKLISEIENLNTIVDLRLRDKETDERYKKTFFKRIEKGDQVFALCKNNQILSYLFVSYNKAFLEQVNISLTMPNKCFAVYDVYTFKEQRGNNYYAQLIYGVCEKMRSKGYESFWLWVMKHNQNSLKVHNKLKINKIISVYKEYYKYGFRNLTSTNVNLDMKSLINNE